MWAHDFSDNTLTVVGGSKELAYIHGIDDFFIHNYAQHFCQCNVWLENEHLRNEGTSIGRATLVWWTCNTAFRATRCMPRTTATTSSCKTRCSVWSSPE